MVGSYTNLGHAFGQRVALLLKQLFGRGMDLLKSPPLKGEHWCTFNVARVFRWIALVAF